MLVSGSPTVSVSDDLGQRLSDSGKARDQSPNTSTARRFFGAAGLQQLQQHLTRRSSSPLGRATVATTATAAAPAAAAASGPKSPLGASPVLVPHQPQAVDPHAAGPSDWANWTPSPAPDTTPAAAAAMAAEEVPEDAAAAADVLVVQQPAREQPAAAGEQAAGVAVAAAAPPQLQPSPVIVMTAVPDAVVAAGSAEAHLTHHLAGKRKHLDGTNSTELMYVAHAKSPAHVYDAAGQQQPQQEQQQQQQQEQPQLQQEQPLLQLQRDDSGGWQLDQQRQQQQQQDEQMLDQQQEQEQEQPMQVDTHELPAAQPQPQQQQQQQLQLQVKVQVQPQQQQQQQQQHPAAAGEEPSPFITQAVISHQLQQQQQQQQPPSPPFLHSLQEVTSSTCQPQSPQLAQQQQLQHGAASSSSPAAAAAAGGGELIGSPGLGRQQSSSPGPSSGSGGDMKPPSLVDMARRVLGRRPELFGPISDGVHALAAAAGGGNLAASRLGPLRRSQSGNAAVTAPVGGLLGAAAAGAPLRTGSHDVSMAAGSMNTASMGGCAAAAGSASMQTASNSHDGAEGGAAAVSSLHHEHSLSCMGPGPIPGPLHKRLGSAASLEVWLGPGSRTPSGSPRSLQAAAAGSSGDQKHLLRTSSSMSTGSMSTGSVARQGSLVLGQPGGISRGSSLDKQPSFAGWPDAAPGAAAAAVAAAAGPGPGPAAAAAGPGMGARTGSFSWPAPAMRTISEDSLKLDIQMLPAVVPEDYPPEPPPESAAAEHDGRLQALHAAQQREQQLREQHHTDRAFFAKVAAWEDELVFMLEQQSTPVPIRNIVSVFKDRIHTERDKAEFKALCDKWTGVVEFPVGSGVKCLAIKSWMRGTHHPHHHPHHDDDSSDDVGSWDDDADD